MTTLGREIYLLAGATLATSIVLTLAMCRFALSRGLLDVPNQRSSHKVPTPRGGGAAIVISAMSGFVLLFAMRRIDFALFAALTGGLAVAAVGFVDDRHPLPALTRLGAHAAAALWGLGWLGGLPALPFGGHAVPLGAFGTVVGVLGIVWVLNLFNFMDGIDGIAGCEATFVAWCGGLLTGGASVGAAALVLGAACLGFLRWNWPPARIFMGDVGSGYLGYVLAVLALAATRNNPVAIWVWLILGGVFFVDATVTLLRRLRRGERVYQAHRAHAYQWLARRWGSHLRVTLVVLLVDIVWLLPCAGFAILHPQYAALIVVVALVPLVGLALTAGAGRSEVP
jgi:Fuc2NAc and GlcNAc transferase